MKRFLITAITFGGERVLRQCFAEMKKMNFLEKILMKKLGYEKPELFSENPFAFFLINTSKFMQEQRDVERLTEKLYVLIEKRGIKKVVDFTIEAREK